MRLFIRSEQSLRHFGAFLFQRKWLVNCRAAEKLTPIHQANYVVGWRVSRQVFLPAWTIRDTESIEPTDNVSSVRRQESG
jgi:hypothetical protein